jgi:hypothetical protein
MLEVASLYGSRPVHQVAERRINEYVAALPSYGPPFEEAVQGPDGSIWLRQTVGGDSRQAQWIVLDSTFTPTSRALVPRSVQSLLFRSDGSWWATLIDDSGVPYVGLLDFREPEREGERVEARVTKGGEGEG